MAFNIFIGWSREDLERELRFAQEDVAAGNVITRAGAGDAMAERAVGKSPEDRIKLILKALNVIDSIAYPIADVTPIDRTRIVFSNAPDPLNASY